MNLNMHGNNKIDLTLSHILNSNVLKNNVQFQTFVKRFVQDMVGIFVKIPPAFFLTIFHLTCIRLLIL